MHLLNSFLQKLEQWDRELFISINSHWANPFFDSFIPFLRIAFFWAPLYLFTLLFVFVNFKWKGLLWTVFAVAALVLTDMAGTYVFKHNFHRLRPCGDPEFSSQVRFIINKCSPGYSFISNHAANHFAMAAFFFTTFRHIVGKWVWIAILWAAIISYGQVYVGVHYPSDVLCGTLLGLLFGFSIGYVFNKQHGFAIFGNQPS